MAKLTMPTATGRTVAYIRVSTSKQDEQLQLDAIEAAGIAKRDRYVDHGVGGKLTSRPSFDRMLADVEPGDVIVVWKLDRLGRSSGHVLTVIHDLVDHGVHVRTLDGIDTTTSTGRAMLGMLAVFAQMEHDFIVERTVAGLAAAKSQGRSGGRPAKLDAKDIAHARRLIDEGDSIVEVAKRLKVSRATLYRALEA